MHSLALVRYAWLRYPGCLRFYVATSEESLLKVYAMGRGSSGKRFPSAATTDTAIATAIASTAITTATAY